jgi:hypothetical protein
MKVELDDKGLIIVPESDFEKDFISQHFSRDKKLTAFVKCGMSPANMIGIKILFSKNEEEEGQMPKV